MSESPITLESIVSDPGILVTAFGRGVSPTSDAAILRANTWAAVNVILFQKTPEGAELLTGPDNATYFQNTEVLFEGPAEEFEEAEIGLLTGQEQYKTATGVYIARNWNGHNDVEVLRQARKSDMPTLLYGPPGTGKTQMAMAAFDEELITVLGSGDTEVADMVGSYVQDPEGNFVWVDGPLIVAAEEGRPLLIDEIGLIDTKVLSILYSLMDGRREYPVTANPERGVVKAKEGFFVVAATNPNAPGIRLSEALLSRFPIQAEVTTDYGIARSLGVHASMIRAAQNLQQRSEFGTGWAPQMRELLAFRDLSKTFGPTFAAASMIAGVPASQRADVAHVLRSTLGVDIPDGKI